MSMSVSNNVPAYRPSYPAQSSNPTQSSTSTQGTQGVSSTQGSSGNSVRDAYQQDRFDTQKAGDTSTSGVDPQSIQTQPLSFLAQSSNQPTDLGADSSSSLPSVKSTDSLGRPAVSADQFLAQGTHSSDQVYPELNYAQSGLGQDKQQIWSAAKNMGATDAESAVLVAQYMQEGSRDGSKDSSGDAANYGPFNLNGGMLKQFAGLSDDQLKGLNGGLSQSLDSNVHAALSAMRNMGTDGYLNDVRGGSTGYTTPTQRVSSNAGVTDDDNARFGRNIANAAQKVLADAQGSGVGNDQRYAGNIPNI